MAFLALMLSTQLSARRAVQTEPNVQAYHLIGYGLLWFVGLLFMDLLCVAGWLKYAKTSADERARHRRAVRVGFLLLVVLSIAFVVENGLLVIRIVT